MKHFIIFILIILLVVAGGVLYYLYEENQKPISDPEVNTELKVDGLVPFEQWHDQNKSQYKLK